MEISIEIYVEAKLSAVWEAWITPEDIINWNFASEDWCCPRAEIELKEGGKFNYRMEAKDGSMGFDFNGEFTFIQPYKSINYKVADGRKVKVEFIETGSGVNVVETFEAKDEHSAEQQKQGWHCILINFKKYVESKYN